VASAHRDGLSGNASISVALCTHNGERFIVEQLESIFSQTILPNEIVLSDDASTDETVRLAQDTVRRLSSKTGAAISFTVLQNRPALGVTRNFEQAVGACAGSLIVLSDQDDRWCPDRIERARDVFAERGELLLLSGDAELVDEAGERLGSTLFQALGITAASVADIHEGNALRLLLRRNFVTGATTTIQSDLVKRAKPFPSGWVHDEWLAIVAAATGVLDVIDEPLIDYRQHSENQIGVVKLGLVGKLRRMREPGDDRNARLLTRAAQLQERFEAMGSAISPAIVRQVAAKLEHERVRSALPASNPRRLPAIVRELQTGRYSEFGRGFPDAVRDLIQRRTPSR
jgi:glycosyltransferase involved in cell wall biosynthesis